ncbi:MAG: Gfo/Idh/MocA family oxidoreductase [Methylobacteriaceae bacterium]|nr:Gfo/Idh/MocA family oxidoreductase [Methylobacteriaceae bacterium]
MRIGILGSGFMGDTHARAFAKIPGVQVAMVSSRRLEKAEKLAAEVGAQATTDDRRIIEEPTIDAISNTLPTHLHPATTIAALRAGKHVLLEKPFALTAPECDGMIAAAKASGRILMVAHVLRFWGSYVSLAEFVHSGRLGKPISAAATRLSQLPAWADWFLDPSVSGGAVLDLSVHDFDVLNWVLGVPKSVYGRGRELRPGLWNDIHVILDYGEANGFVEGSEFMPQGYPFTCGLKILCEGGIAEFIFRAGGVSVEMGGASSLLVHEAGKAFPLVPKPGDAYENQIEYFVECVRDGRMPAQGTPEQARLAVQTANAARRSFETGAVVPI